MARYAYEEDDLLRRFLQAIREMYDLNWPFACSEHSRRKTFCLDKVISIRILLLDGSLFKEPEGSIISAGLLHNWRVAGDM